MGRRQMTAGGALAAVVLAAAGCGIGSSSARSTTASFFQAFGEGNGREACSLIAPGGARRQVLDALAQSEAQKAAARRGSCDELARALPPKRKTLFGTVVVDPAPSSGGQTVTARFEKESGSPTVPYSVRLNERGGDWKLVSINSGGAP